MKLISVNLGTARDVQIGSRIVSTGIYKFPTGNPVMIATDHVEGDDVTDTKNHGGPDQAVYIYGGGDYAWWEQTLGYKIEPGSFGENLTISDLESAQVFIGDRLQVGSVLLEVTAPRIPCSVFEKRMEEHAWVKRFHEGGRPGLYCRVITMGQVCAGDAVELIPNHQTDVTITDMFNIHYEKSPTEAELRRLLSAPISIRSREDYEEKLATLIDKA